MPLLSRVRALFAGATLALLFAAGAASAAPLSIASIKSQADFAAYAVPSGGMIPVGRTLKFVIDQRRAKETKIAFINGNYTENGVVPKSAQLHYFFARQTMAIKDDLKTFNETTYFTERKRFVVGMIQEIETGDYAVFFYAQDLIREAAVLAAIKRIRQVFLIPGATLSFLQTAPQQTALRAAAAFKQEGVEVRSVEEVMAELSYLPLHLGEAVGRLRLFPDPADLAPGDIGVLDEIPDELPDAAATITTVGQDPTSPFFLAAFERDTPNMILREARANDELKGWADKPVRLTVTTEGFRLQKSTAAAVAQSIAERERRPAQAPGFKGVDAVVSVDELCPVRVSDCLASATRYGSDAAMLGFLAHHRVLGRANRAGSLSQKLGRDLSPRAVAVPLAAYRRFAEHPIASDWLIALRKKLLAVFPKTTRLVVRASANVAGEHSDVAAVETACPKRKSAKLDPLACAVKAMYASFSSDAKDAAMGLTIVAPSAELEEAPIRGVVVTRILGSPMLHGYVISLQNEKRSEVHLATIGYRGDLTFTQTQGGANRLVEEAALRSIVQIARQAEEAYCRAKPGYFPLACKRVSWDRDKIQALVLELEITARSRVVVERMREFSPQAPP